MGRRIEALVNPDLLIWARESAGLSISDVSAKLKLTEEKLYNWENGIARPTIGQLRKLGKLYKRPIAVFYLPEKPIDFSPLKDYRRLPGVVGFRQIPELKNTIRQAYLRRDIALELCEELGEEIKTDLLSININDDPEQTAQFIRNTLNINLQKQINWSNEYEALDSWRIAVENQGLLVFQSGDVDISEMRGFSIFQTPLPVIGLNTKDTPKGRIFSLLHEFTHIILRQDSICDIHEDSDRHPEEQKIEVFCNHIAGAILVPKSDLLSSEYIKSGSITNDSLIKTASLFKVSKEVILRRLLISNVISQSYYKNKRSEFLKEYEKLKQKKRTGFVLPHVQAISSAGLTFTRLVLNSYYQERITSSDVSDFLQVRTKHLPKIESDLSDKAAKLGVAF